MSQQNINLAQNTLYLTLASVGQKAVAFLYFAMIARFMGVEDTGSYFLALAVIMILMALDDVGITSVLIREIAKKTSDAKVWSQTVLGIKVITIPVTVMIAFFLPLVLGYGADVTLLIRLAIVIMVADTLSLSFYGILRGLHLLKYEAVGLFMGQIIAAIAGTIFLLTGIASLPLLIVALMTGSLWNMIFSAFQVVRKLGIKALVPTWRLGWDPMKMALAFFMAAIFVKVYSYVDSIILSIQIGEHAVGIYAVAYKLTYAFQFIPLAFVAALYPAMAARANDQKKLKQTLDDALWYVMLIGVPIVLGIWALAPEIIHAFYGSEFEASILPLQILIFVLLFIFLDFPLGSLLNATNRQVTKTAIMGVTMIINVGANLLLIPVYGVAGACYAGLVSFAFMVVAGWFFVQRVVDLKVMDLIRSTWGIVLASLVMATVVIMTKPLMHFVLSIMLGAVVYTALIFAFGSIKPAHLKKFWRLMRPNGNYENPPSNS